MIKLKAKIVVYYHKTVDFFKGLKAKKQPQVEPKAEQIEEKAEDNELTPV